MALALALACQSRAERAEIGDVARIAGLVERLRDADPSREAGALTRLEQATCAGVVACSLKDVCLRAHRLRRRALRQALALGNELQVPESDAGTAVRLAELPRTRSDLALAAKLVDECHARQVRSMRETLLR